MRDQLAIRGAFRRASAVVRRCSSRAIPPALLILGLASAARAQDMGVWRFEDPDASAFLDSSPRGSDAQEVLAAGARPRVRLKATPMGHGLLFSGKEARVAVDEQISFGLSAGDSRTMEVWFSRVRATGQEMELVSRQSAPDAGGYGIFIAAQGDARARFRDGNGETQEIASGVSVVDLAPHHVAVVRDWPLREFRIYVDGTLRATLPETAPGNYDSGTLAFGALAGPSGGFASYFRGVLDEVRIQSEVNVLYRTDAVVVGAWRFDEKRGSSAADSSASGDDMHFASLGGAGGRPGWTRGVLGSALRFDGRRSAWSADEQVTLAFGPTESWAVSLWVKGKALGRFQGILCRGAAGTTEGYAVFVSLAGTIVAQARDDFGTNMNIDSGVPFGDDRSYHHVLFVRDYSNTSHSGSYRLTVDGVFRGTRIEVSSGSFAAGTLQLGALPGDWPGGESPLSGSVDSLTILRWVK